LLIMIVFLVGLLAAIEQGERCSVVLNVNGVGYRIKVPARILKDLPMLETIVKLHTHQMIRETEINLYGFLQAAERDLFVELIKVSGVGPAVGLALLNTLALPELVQAIVSNNSRVLALAPGVGTKTAQRLALELKTKLANWRQEASFSSGRIVPSGIQEDVEMTLLALGYTPQEITQTLQAIAQENLPPTTEEWVRAAITHLSI
jgi:Holliday junction DNA helicase RuvA